MNPLQTIIIHHIRASASLPLADKIAEWSDDELLKRVFANYRDRRGLRITLFGQQLLNRCFQSFHFDIDELLPAQALYLATRCKMPYFANGRVLVVYDPQFAVQLRLAGNSIATLIEIDSFK